MKMNKIKKLLAFLTVRNVSHASLALNAASIIFGILYLSIPIYTVVWNIFGVILLISLFCNVLLVYLNDRELNKVSKSGNRLNLLCYGYLIFMIAAMLGMFLGNHYISGTYSNDSVIGYGVVYFSYFGLLAFGIVIAYLDIRTLSNSKVWDTEQGPESTQSGKFANMKRKLRALAKVLGFSCLILGIYFAYLPLSGISAADLKTQIGAIIGLVNGGVGIIVTQLALFLAFVTLSITIVLLKLRDVRENRRHRYAVAIIGLALTAFFMLPLSLTPYTISTAERNFTGAFGENWRDGIDPDAEEHFLKGRFSMPGYFLGIPPKDCRIIKNVRFYEGEGVKLHFDAYMPLGNGKELPGENSTIIRIHGGGWIGGDKGKMNMMQINKYFAAQGYVVFDIQYGLRDMNDLDMTPFERAFKGVFNTANDMKGDFDVDDMVRHIGIFTKYLVDHSDEYGANLDSVFISGGSAGGHLACATAFAIGSENYTHMFGPDLTIKGLIPFYPPNGVQRNLVEGSPELLNPEELVREDSPPCLVFHGTSDGWVPPRVTQSLKNTYTSMNNEECAILWMPLGGHACDSYFPGYYNQVFLYYMERFLYLYH